MERPDRIIDAHLHFQPDRSHFDVLAQAVGHTNSEAHLRHEYARLNIERGIVMGNRELSNTPHVYPKIFRYCVGIHQHALDPALSKESIAGAETQLRNPQCVGVKIYAGYCPLPIMDEAFRPYYELASAYNKPVAVHMGVTASPNALLKHCHPLQLDELAVNYPNLTIVMCHFGNPWLMDAAAVVEKNNNVFVDLSGIIAGAFSLPDYLRSQSQYVDTLRMWINYVERDDAFMFGTDWPLVNLEEYIRFVSELIPQSKWDDVFYNNAKAVYKL
ncbi:hypothetical protein FACS18948_7410 [Clostridia bacterium]|nr:hypothetical protein FACS18948_7410 [Clostridia bacterium]